MDRIDPNNQNVANDGPPDQGNEDSSLNRTGRLFGGLIADVKRKAPWYLSDFRDGFYVRCFTSVFLMFCGCLTTMVTFGSLLGMVTNNNISMTVTFTSGAICGFSYYLFCGQPLTILSSTGSILVFEGIVYSVCTDFNWYYLGFRFWIGFWIFVIFLIFVAFDLSFLVRYITRFTQECFATLLAFIFIYEAFSKQFQQRQSLYTMKVLNENCVCQYSSQFENVDGNNRKDLTVQSSWTRDSNLILTIEDCQRRNGNVSGSDCKDEAFTPTFCFSVFLFLGTFLFVFLLKQLTKTRFVPLRVRSCISDLAIIVVVILMVLLNAAVGLRTVKLYLPFINASGRPDGWIVKPLQNSWLTIFFAIPPAILMAILMFIDQHFPTVMISHKDRKLKKGSGFHLDLLIIAVQVILCSAFGCPWFVGATVLSLNHIHSLTVEAPPSSPGEQPLYLGIREQRVTGLLVSLLLGMAVLLTPLITIYPVIPISVFYGVLLYMGVASLQGMQFLRRVFFFFKRRGCSTANPAFTSRIPNVRICLFSFFQVICFAVSCFVKRIHMITILFPLMVIVTCGVRKALERVFSYEELLCLDDILPGSKRTRTENGARTDENAAAMELQASTEASRMMPTAPDVTVSSEPRGVYEDPLPDASPPPYDSMPPPYHVAVQQAK